MTYQLIDFQTPATRFEGLLKNAKRSGNYDDDPDSYDKSLIKILDPLVKESLALTKDFDKRVHEVHQGCKKAMDEMEVLIKKKGKSLSESDMRILTTLAGSLARHARDLQEKSSDMYKALGHFREGWPDTYRKLLHDPELIKPFIAARLKSIDEGKQVDALKRRIEDYAVRGADMLKAAEKIAKINASVGGSDPVADAKEVKAFGEEATRLAELYGTFDQKATTSLKQMSEVNPKVKPDAPMMKMYDSRMTNGVAEAKNARGTLKTLTIKIDTFKKIASKMEGDAKKAAAIALDTAGKALKTCETKEKTLAKYEKKAEEVMKALGKLK